VPVCLKYKKIDHDMGVKVIKVTLYLNVSRGEVEITHKTAFIFSHSTV
jgi:hypothetical protein